MTSTAILLGFVLVLIGRFFLIPLFREWPGDQPESRQLRRLASTDEYWRYFTLVTRTMPSIRNIPKAERLSPQLSEKVMLAVCGVNQCAKCSYLHTRTALEKGVQKREIQELLEGQYEGIAADELPAILYAQHFAESGGDVSPEARQRVVDAYGEHKVSHLSAYLLAVYFGNLCCNTVQFFEHGRLESAERSSLYLVYLLARPVDWFIVRNARQKEYLRTIREGS